MKYSTLRDRSIAEGWVALRESAQSKAVAASEQKAADAAADNAALAADIKHRLLERLKRIEAKYPLDATEVRSRNANSTAIFRLRDLTAAYKDLIADMPAPQAPNELLQSLFDLEREARQ